MLRSLKYRRISTNLSEDSDCGKSIADSVNCHQQFNLRKIVLYNFKNKRLQSCFALRKRLHMAADDLEIFSLLKGKEPVNCFLNLCNRRFTTPMHQGSNIKGCSVAAFMSSLPNNSLQRKHHPCFIPRWCLSKKGMVINENSCYYI